MVQEGIELVLALELRLVLSGRGGWREVGVQRGRMLLDSASQALLCAEEEFVRGAGSRLG